MTPGIPLGHPAHAAGRSAGLAALHRRNTSVSSAQTKHKEVAFHIINTQISFASGAKGLLLKASDSDSIFMNALGVYNINIF